MMDYSGEALEGNLRLKGLKNVAGRRRVLGDPKNEMQQLDMDTALASTNQNNLTNDNLPVVETGGELSPQSYDVRANKVIDEDPSVFQRFGRAIAGLITPEKEEPIPQGDYAYHGYKAPVPDQQNQPSAFQRLGKAISNTFPPKQIEPEMEYEPGVYMHHNYGKSKDEIDRENAIPKAREGFFGALEDYNDINKQQEDKRYRNRILEDTRLREQGIDPVQYRENKKAADQDAISKAQENPYETVAYGATDKFANNPELIQQFEQYTGQEFDEQTKELTEKYEKVLSDIENNLNENNEGYDEQSARIKERILANQANDMDKYYVGLALLMPLLVGGFFGKEAGLSALAGASKGIGNLYSNRADQLASDEDLLASLNKERINLNLKRGELDLERLKIPQEVKKGLPKNPYEDLVGKDIHTFTDPVTGKVVGNGVEILPDFYADLKYANTAKDREKMMEKGDKLAEEKSSLQIANQATEDVINAARQLQTPGLAAKIISLALSDDKSGMLKKLVNQNSDTIMVDGRQVNAAVYLNAKIEQIKDAYRRNEHMNAFTKTIANHIGAMAENPQYSGLNPTDLIDQMLIMRDRSQNFFINRLKSQGFIAEPVMSKFGEENRNIYKGLNRDIQKKEIEEDKLKIIQNNK